MIDEITELEIVFLIDNCFKELLSFRMRRNRSIYDLPKEFRLPIICGNCRKFESKECGARRTCFKIGKNGNFQMILIQLLIDGVNFYILNQK